MSKQDETLIEGFLDAKASEEALIKLAQELVDVTRAAGGKLDQDKAFEVLVSAREIRNSLNRCWAAYTKRATPHDLGGSAPPQHTAPSYKEIQEADEFMASGQPPTRRVPPKPAIRRVPPRRKKT